MIVEEEQDFFKFCLLLNISCGDSHLLCISAYNQGESCIVLLCSDEASQWPQLGQFFN